MRRAVLVLLAMGVAACTPKAPLVVQSAGLQPSITAIAPLPAGCGLWLGEVQDKRSAVVNTGPTGRTIDLADVADVVRERLLAMGLAASRSQPASRVQVELLHAYIGGGGTMKQGNVALRIQVGTQAARIARGNRTSQNWNSSDDELSGAIAGALGDALATVRADLVGHCTAH